VVVLEGLGGSAVVSSSSPLLWRVDRERQAENDEGEGVRERDRGRGLGVLFAEHGRKVASMHMHGRAMRCRAPASGQPRHLPPARFKI
jgi:hypothetical protein